MDVAIDAYWAKMAELSAAHTADVDFVLRSFQKTLRQWHKSEAERAKLETLLGYVEYCAEVLAETRETTSERRTRQELARLDKYLQKIVLPYVAKHQATTGTSKSDEAPITPQIAPKTALTTELKNVPQTTPQTGPQAEPQTAPPTVPATVPATTPETELQVPPSSPPLLSLPPPVVVQPIQPVELQTAPSTAPATVPAITPKATPKTELQVPPSSPPVVVQPTQPVEPQTAPPTVPATVPAATPTTELQVPPSSPPVVVEPIQPVDSVEVASAIDIYTSFSSSGNTSSATTREAGSEVGSVDDVVAAYWLEHARLKALHYNDVVAVQTAFEKFKRTQTVDNTQLAKIDYMLSHTASCLSFFDEAPATHGIRPQSQVDQVVSAIEHLIVPYMESLTSASASTDQAHQAYWQKHTWLRQTYLADVQTTLEGFEVYVQSMNDPSKLAYKALIQAILEYVQWTFQLLQETPETHRPRPMAELQTAHDYVITYVQPYIAKYGRSVATLQNEGPTWP
ncbi:unnamed protein product [Aphanomyces euteiches]|uniref:Uncharacterized protein n=1 Tax=Aphanomyces euteiches TaxID=100861 RepID=A0A6G0WYD6_9STRA|nr:hypothetical protein Ae201684_010306 [Aphanomyces euteiches]KAH9090313.1 hypothetical protein Ae201684P_014119 [Aphanomyces euteiches]KAH9145175.1 hypothetical protein AeRB84_010904 [Aphanomyces euteiches]